MAIEEEQSVAAETDVAAKPATEESGAQDLDALLSEFETGVAESETTKPATTETTADEGQGEQTTDVKEAVEYFKAQQAEDSKRRTDETISSAVTAIAGDLDAKLPESAIRGIIYEKAESDPRFLKAFQQRDQNPETWGKVLKAIAGGLNKEMADAPDTSLTNDRRNLAAAVQSASSTAPNAGDAPISFGTMSDTDLAEHRRLAVRAAR